MKKLHLSIVVLATILWSCGGSGEANKKLEQIKNAEKQQQDEALLKKAQGFFKVLPEAKAFEGALTELGKKLYYETALSINNEMSCNSCHLLDNFGVDNEATSPGHDGTRGDRNSPTVYNAYFHVAQFWDGRAADLVEQAKGPILNPIEMGLKSEADAVKAIKNIEEYKKMFAKAFPDAKDPITYHNIAVAIGEFEATLSTPAPFDAYLSGDLAALNDQQKRGMETFINSGCITCHMGPGLGGNMYQKFGLINGPYWDYTKSVKQDEGRFEHTKNEADKYFFKVPALRNVAKTHPYFHDGSVADLGEAVKIMAITQLNKELSDDEVKDIVAFLESLTGEIPAHALLSTL